MFDAKEVAVKEGHRRDSGVVWGVIWGWVDVGKLRQKRFFTSGGDI